MYPNEESEQSLKGDHWHKLMEDLITFGALPKDADATAAEELEKLFEYVLKRVAEGGPGTRVYVEQRLDIPQTGEFGTVDILIVAPLWTEVIDLKSGYVPVDVVKNAQMLVYLLGAIAAHGPRPAYRITIFQPNYDHVDGPLRSYDPMPADLAELEQNIAYSLKATDECNAGPHCKETYCDHRGACAAFHAYVLDDLAVGWHTHEVKSMDDETLATALDAADQLAGYRTELRTEAMRRIMNMDRQIDGYKVVKGRRSRAVTDPLKVVQVVWETMGIEWARKLLPDLEWVPNLQPTLPAALKCLGTPKHIEDVIKQYARQAGLPRGTWTTIYDNTVGKYIRETASGLTLEKAIDGRPAHKRGSEFGTLNPADGNKGTTVL
jgi:hypothetical protein